MVAQQNSGYCARKLLKPGCNWERPASLHHTTPHRRAVKESQICQCAQTLHTFHIFSFCATICRSKFTSFAANVQRRQPKRSRFTHKRPATRPQPLPQAARPLHKQRFSYRKKKHFFSLVEFSIPAPLNRYTQCFLGFFLRKFKIRTPESKNRYFCTRFRLKYRVRPVALHGAKTPPALATE